MKNIRTVYDAGQARRDEAAASFYRAADQEKIRNAKVATMRQFPQIGILIRKGKEIFYAYIGGYAESNYVEHADLNVIAGKCADASSEGVA